MTEPSDTPRVDLFQPSQAAGTAQGWADFARQLERELAAARADWLKAASSNVSLRDDLVLLRADRDRLAAENVALKQAGQAFILKVAYCESMGMWNACKAEVDALAALAQERKP